MKSKLAMILLATVAASANAEYRQFRFTGTVSQSTPMAPAGAKVTGSFSYHTEALPDVTLGDPSGQGTTSASYVFSRQMTLEVNGHTVVSESTRIEIVDNFGGNVEDSVSIQGLPLTLDGTGFSEGVFGIFLASGPGKTGVLRGTDLPQRIAVKRFDGMNYGFVQVDGSSNGTLLAFTVDSVRAKDSREDD